MVWSRRLFEGQIEVGAWKRCVTVNAGKSLKEFFPSLYGGKNLRFRVWLGFIAREKRKHITDWLCRQTKTAEEINSRTLDGLIWFFPVHLRDFFDDLSSRKSSIVPVQKINSVLYYGLIGIGVNTAGWKSASKWECHVMVSEKKLFRRSSLVDEFLSQ